MTESQLETTTQEQLPPLQLSSGPARFIASAEDLQAFSSDLGLGSGPVAIDAERASGYRYSQRAYLIQVRRRNAGSALIDPIAVPDLACLSAALADTEWILHAATQDLPCLAEVGLRPHRLFDTELAGRLLGRDRVGLAGLVASELGFAMAKEHGATDWSARPLSSAQLTYAALDVEPLADLRTVLGAALDSQNRGEIAQQEFDNLLTFTPKPRGQEPWRRLSGIHKLRSSNQLAIARELWLVRDTIARESDRAPGRVLRDAAIVALALANPATIGDLGAVPDLNKRSAKSRIPIWWEAVQRARAQKDQELPVRNTPSDGPPPPRTWAQRNPDAHTRLTAARDELSAAAASWGIAVELLIAPDLVRRLCWEPPADTSEAGLRTFLTSSGARPWQVDANLEIFIGVLGD